MYLGGYLGSYAMPTATSTRKALSEIFPRFPGQETGTAMPNCIRDYDRMWYGMKENTIPPDCVVLCYAMLLSQAQNVKVRK